MKVIFLDTETTGLDPEARLVQLGYKVAGENGGVDLLFKPPVAISVGSMATHHITNEMVADKEPFEGSEAKKELEKILGDEYILVAHNAPYDINILNNEGVKVGEYIDTLTVAKHLIKSENYKLQYLRYGLKFDIKADAHDAWGDILVLEKLFYYLVEVIEKRFEVESEDEIINKMLELTNTPILLEEFAFGKHKGKTFVYVADNDQGYIRWLYESETSKSELEQNRDLVFTLKNYLK